MNFWSVLSHSRETDQPAWQLIAYSLRRVNRDVFEAFENQSKSLRAHGKKTFTQGPWDIPQDIDLRLFRGD